MRRLYSAANLPEAYLVLDRLRVAGIEARVFNENAQGGLGEIPFTHAYPEVWVIDDADWTRARQLVDDYEDETPGDTTVDIRCPSCAEANPASFQLCWNCGAILEGN